MSDNTPVDEAPPADPRNLDGGPVFVVPDIKFDESPDIPSVGIRKGYGVGEIGNGGPTGPTGPAPEKKSERIASRVFLPGIFSRAPRK